MTDESQLQIRPKDDNSSTSLSKVGSGLIARGRRDAAMLTALVEAGPEEKRRGLYLNWLYHAWIPSSGPEEKIRQGADQGDTQQQASLVLLFIFGNLKGGEALAESVPWYRKTADKGYAPAQFVLGWEYDNSNLMSPVEQDDGQAAKWYRKAADQGHAPAQFNLGVMYDRGEGVGQDYTEAAKWYRMAADQGFVEAQFNLGLKYEKGQGVDQDYAEAVEWYRMAADRGLDRAQLNLGLKYYKGQGVVQSYSCAHLWTTLAAAHAYDDDQKSYAAIRDRVAARMNPTQIGEAERLAAQWYRKAAEQGSMLAQLNLGLRYTIGQGVTKDYAEAAKWYRKAADQGSYKLQDYVQAYMWVSLASTRCFDEAIAAEHKAKLDSIAAKMTPTQVAEAKRLARESCVTWDPIRNQTHMWVNLAASYFYDKAISALRKTRLDSIAGKTTPTQVAEAERLARE